MAVSFELLLRLKTGYGRTLIFGERVTDMEIFANARYSRMYVAKLKVIPATTSQMECCFRNMVASTISVVRTNAPIRMPRWR